ncbi:MAG: hypothetical protein ACJ0G4_04045 [Alphaproteobacteria bacterium]
MNEDAVDEIGQLLSDIQQEEDEMFESPEDSLNNLSDSDEKLPPSPTKEYDSVLLENENEVEEIVAVQEESYN